MIRVRPGIPAFDVLVVVVDHPGKMTAEDIGQKLWRPRVTGTENYLAVRRAILEHGAGWTAKASTLLQRLKDAGCVEGMRPPQVAAAYAELAATDAAAAVEDAAWDARVEGPPDPGGRRAELVADLVRRVPASMREWVGATPSGHTQAAVADLVEWGLVVPPTKRWPTEKGIAMVREWRVPTPAGLATVERMRGCA